MAPQQLNQNSPSLSCRDGAVANFQRRVPVDQEVKAKIHQLTPNCQSNHDLAQPCMLKYAQVNKGYIGLLSGIETPKTNPTLINMARRQAQGSHHSGIQAWTKEWEAHLWLDQKKRRNETNRKFGSCLQCLHVAA